MAFYRVTLPTGQQYEYDQPPLLEQDVTTRRLPQWDTSEDIEYSVRGRNSLYLVHEGQRVLLEDGWSMESDDLKYSVLENIRQVKVEPST